MKTRTWASLLAAMALAVGACSSSGGDDTSTTESGAGEPTSTQGSEGGGEMGLFGLPTIDPLDTTSGDVGIAGSSTVFPLSTAVLTQWIDEGGEEYTIDSERDRIDSIRRDFVANASHELKTPVATIIASSEAMRIAQSRGDQSVDSFADRIESSARQLDDLVSDLLDLSRLERETPEMSPVRVDLLVGDEVERVRSIADERGISLSLEVSAITTVASHRDLAIAVRNLLDNAIRYTSGDGSIKVMVDSDEKHVRISVADTGEGIPTRDLDRVFERFYRVDSARARSTGGTGLGLSIVKHVAESHKGSVSVDSELGVGSRFVINLPMGEESADN